MKIGETWSLYVCTSQADLRYTLGTSIGRTFRANPELRVMEGAGALLFNPDFLCCLFLESDFRLDF